MNINDIYKYSYNYLVEMSKNEVTIEQINNFINQYDGNEISSIEEVFELLMNILQDFQMYPKVIKYSERSNDIKETIHFPDLKYCAKLDATELSKYFIKKYNSNSKVCWYRYCKGIISAAKFLSQYKDYNEFKTVCDSFDSNDVTREAFALFLQTKIDNMGFSIACNWLKELGYINYPKPDVHMKDICQALDLINEKRTDIDCFEAIIKVARECNVEPYKLDKVWWLISTGKFYRYNIQLPNPQKNKTDFLEKVSNRINFNNN